MAKEKTQHTIVLGKKTDRESILKTLSEKGGKVLHDSGERVLIIEVPKGTRLTDRLPEKAKLLRLNAELKREVTRPTAHEQLFMDAMKLKVSTAFINERKQRVPGSTPQEQEMFLASDYLGEEY